MYILLSVLFIFLFFSVYLRKKHIALELQTMLKEYEKLNYYRFLETKKAYLQSSIWKKKRKEVMIRDNYTCRLCNKKDLFDIHHISGYDLIPNEGIEHLVLLCRNCHDKQHRIYGYPKTYHEYMLWNAPLKTYNQILKINLQCNTSKETIFICLEQ